MSHATIPPPRSQAVTIVGVAVMLEGLGLIALTVYLLVGKEPAIIQMVEFSRRIGMQAEYKSTGKIEAGGFPVVLLASQTSSADARARAPGRRSI